MNKRKLIIISDLHIGGDEIIEDFACEKELISFLKAKGKYKGDLELLILGDFFDLWKVENDAEEQVQFIIKNHKKLFKAFKDFGGKHTITVVPGNHDHALFYNEKYQEDLLKYNIKVDSSQFFKREFINGDKSFTIIGEHGNQVEPSTEFPDFNMPTDSSLAYHVNKILVYKLMRMGNEEKSPDWLKEMDNIETDLIPHWVVSKYFYYELGPILKAMLIPMLILFSFAVPFFIFDVVTEFYQPRFLQPIITLFDTNTFFKFIIFVMYFNMVIVAMALFAILVKYDFRKRLREYGIHSFTEILVSRLHAYKNRAKEVMKGNNDFEEEADFYVTGHTHVAGIHKIENTDTRFLDTGSWKQLMKRIPARLQFPSVYVPYFSLNYATFQAKGDEMIIKLKRWPKSFTPKLTMLEKIAAKKIKAIPKPSKGDRTVKEIRLPLTSKKMYLPKVRKSSRISSKKITARYGRSISTSKKAHK